MKKIRFRLLSIITMCGLAFLNVNASCENYTQEELDYIITNSNPTDLDFSCSKGSIYTQEYLEKIEKSLNEIKENDYGIVPYYFTDPMLDVTPYQQETSYYCGPANVKMVLQYLNGTSKSQSAYASSMGTNNNGTYVYKITNELNKYSSKKYQYAKNLSQDTFKSVIDSDIANNKPLILHAKTGSLEKYNGHNADHYLTVNGHTLRGYPGITDDNVYYVDSNNKNYGNGSTFGKQSDTFAKVYNTIKDNRYVIY